MDAERKSLDRSPENDIAEACRCEFAFVSRGVAWLDNAATTQRPERVLAAMDEFSRFHNANVRRGVHRLGAEATAMFEGAREEVAAFLGATDAAEVIFTSGTTEGINLVAAGARKMLAPGDEIWVTAMEHHSNWVPWLMAARASGAKLRVVPITPEGRLDMAALQEGLHRAAGRAKWVAATWISNVLGTENDVCVLCDVAHAAGARVVLDGAQGVAHRPVNVRAAGCDFFAFSGHKMFGPAGTGVLWGRREWLEGLEPAKYGGEMISRVEEQAAEWAPPPYRFEGGTPNTAGAVGLAEAIRWVRGWPAAWHGYVERLAREAARRLAEIPGIRVLGAPEKVSLVSFAIEGIHAHDVAQVLDARGVAVRAGHLCAQPLLQRLGVESVVRASFAPYNSLAELDALVAGVREARELFS